jgi:hypothetical protein
MSCGCVVWPRCGCDVAFAPTLRPPPAERPTTPIPGHDRIAAFVRHRLAIDALWRNTDALWDQMTDEERQRAVASLGGDWLPRR